MHRRAAVRLILLIVVALRSLVPAGFMLQDSEASAGSFEIVVCTSSGTKLLSFDDNGAPVTPASKSQPLEQGICPFAGVVALAPGKLPALGDQVAYAAVTYALAVALFAETPKPGATSARGPPSDLV